MVRRLLLAIDSLHGSFATRAGLSLFALVMLPFAWLVDRGGAWNRARRLRAALAMQAATCDRCGTGIELANVAVRCPSCHLTFVGHMFEECPFCGSFGHGVCACGAPVVHPVATLDGTAL